MNSDFQTMIKILNILQKYEIKPGSFKAQHDVIYTNVNPDIVTNDDCNQLLELGCHIDNEYDCFAFFT